MSSAPTEAEYGSWKSPITSSFVTNEKIKDIRELQLDMTDFGTGHVYWMMRIFEEANMRGCVYTTNMSLPKEERAITEWTPYPFSCRNFVHEYGGGAFICHAGLVFFITPNNLYRQEASNHIPDPFSHLNIDTGTNRYRYADPCYAHGSIYVVREDHQKVEDGENRFPDNNLVRMSPASCRVEVINDIHEYILPTAQKIASGADFYAAPRVSLDGTKLAWMQWFHPNMPWDATEIWVADLDEDGELVSCSERKLLGDGKTNYSTPTWDKRGNLYVMADTSNWWNIYQVDLVNGVLKHNVHPIDADLGCPHWNFGSRNQLFHFDRESDRMVLAVEEKLIVKDLSTGRDRKLNVAPYSSFHSVWFGKDNCIYCIAGSSTRPRAVIQYCLETDILTVIEQDFDLSEIDPGYISSPSKITFPTGDNGKERAFGYFYPPQNKDFNAPSATLPPVILLAHGGPTGTTTTEFDLSKQYYTSRGFAIFDVNFRGSTGFGREYRDKLYGEWGVIDLEDMECAAKHLISEKLVDPEKVCIKGSSSGGYLALRAATNPLFKAAVSLYGVSDLEMLQQDTHKFELSYDAKLIAPYPEKIEVFKERSPISHLDEICCPIAFFHGMRDKVVPHNQAEKMHAAVKEKGLVTTLVLYERESHGFRVRKNIETTYDGSYVFLCRVLGIAPSVQPPELNIMHIDNLYGKMNSERPESSS